MSVGSSRYGSPQDVPGVVPVFPLPGALLLPRGQLPLNIFEPRYVAMVDAALAGDRVIGMIQPAADTAVRNDPGDIADTDLCTVGCLGRITSFQESGDGRYVINLAGIARFVVISELTVITDYRQCHVDYTDFGDDFIGHVGEEMVDRDGLLKVFKDYLTANDMEADWESVQSASSETLVNALSMMSPYGPAEKQALLEAPDLKTRAETLVAITEFELARSQDSGTILQ